jgi:DNA-binding transcriptional ArsR family regulator
MVEYTLSLDNIFSSLSDPTRRDILRRVARQEMSIGEIARYYDLTFAAVSKHLKVLERARLIIKQRRGKEQMVTVVPQTLKDADEYLEQYRRLWEERFDRLDALLNNNLERK